MKPLAKRSKARRDSSTAPDGGSLHWAAAVPSASCRHSASGQTAPNVSRRGKRLAKLGLSQQEHCMDTVYAWRPGQRPPAHFKGDPEIPQPLTGNETHFQSQTHNYSTVSENSSVQLANENISLELGLHRMQLGQASGRPALVGLYRGSPPARAVACWAGLLGTGAVP